MAIELTDFSVYYTQGAMEAVIAALREGKSQVVCDGGQLYKVSKSKDKVISRDKLTKAWTDWVDYWAVDFEFETKREIVRVRRPLVEPNQGNLQDMDPPQPGLAADEYEDVWTGDYVFENEWQSFRTRKDRTLELVSTAKEVPPGRRKIAVKVVDIFGNDTMKIVEVTV